MTDKFDIVIFTDGASKGNPGPGGFGAIVIDQIKGNIVELGGAEKSTTNNRMELTAIVRAFEQVKTEHSSSNILVLSDSEYSINGITKWVSGWQKNGWKTKAKSDVLNKDLWEKLSALVEGKKIEWKHVEGHVGVAGNERVDVIASDLAEGKTVALYSGNLKDYPLKNILELSENANQKSAKSGKAYSYISLVDGSVKAHKDWASCESVVKGKKAKFKKVFSEEEERELIKEWSK